MLVKKILPTQSEYFTKQCTIHNAQWLANTFGSEAHHSDGGMDLPRVHPGRAADAVVALLEQRKLGQQQRRRDLQGRKLVQHLQHVGTFLVLPVLVSGGILRAT